jgi:hypothetical protein
MSFCEYRKKYKLTDENYISIYFCGCLIPFEDLWRSSKTPRIQQALSNAYFKSEGLYVLPDGWIKLHYSG